MIRTHLALVALLSLAAVPAFAQDTVQPESGSDATTPMDHQAGNLTPPTDNTLSNQEVETLQSGKAAGVARPSAQPAPSVEGTTPSYEQKGGSAAKTEGGDSAQ